MAVMTPGRLVVYSPQDEFLFEINDREYLDGSMMEAINGQHQLEVVSKVPLEKEQRILWCDDTSKVYEFVVAGGNADHAGGRVPIGTYRAVWSLQHDLSVCNVSRMPGVQTPTTAYEALGAVLSGTDRWSVGTVTAQTLGGASMYDMPAWNAMAVLLENWGGEIDAVIEVSDSGVVSRSVDLRPMIGASELTRRFDYARDLVSIGRDVSDEPVACRIIPRGKGEESGDGYGRRIKIGDVNGGVDWLQNNVAAELYKMPDGNGGYEYPTVYADNDSIDDKQELKEWGLSVLNDYTTPKVTYRSDVLQYALAGMDVHGVVLGNPVQCVDRKFSPEGLRIEGRVIERTVNLKDRRRTTLTIGHMRQSFVASSIKRVQTAITELSDGVTESKQMTSDLIDNLLARINQQINRTGGYTYLVEGIGAITYDTAVADPSDGDEASQVTEMRGGTLRFANSRTQSGDWDWRTVLTADGINGELVTALRAVFGYIESATGSTRIDLDNDTFRFPGITYDPVAGALVLGFDGVPLIQNRITASGQSYLVNGAALAEYGVEGNTSKMWAQIVSVLNRLEFGNFAWIARQNGNMTLKWIGE